MWIRHLLSLDCNHTMMRKKIMFFFSCQVLCKVMKQTNKKNLSKGPPLLSRYSQVNTGA